MFIQRRSNIHQGRYKMLHAISQQRTTMPLSMLSDVHSLRYKVFHQRLNWQVPVNGELEVDEYDELDPTFIVSQGECGDVVGCMRLLKTTGPYMLADTFPQLLGGKAAPRDKNILEISRFATMNAQLQHNTKGISEITYSLLQKAYLHAVNEGVDAYVMVTTTAIERYLRRMGITTERLADSQDIGGVNSVALYLHIDQRFQAAVFRPSTPTLLH
ncbi:acyl-homoserine-lactone synthase [Veronia nyctiphanis]|uniref:Acyl-homoserine-lactone synthase n=1 Tax=Veronia nyctiphanis TaxID=1278244 RepID=A0A4Q0YKR4_9GAMM|nr:acyl-homoserine-lactone synthase [Veronia nyctiphanis]RXJ71246.1 acyl-homoserine-lactone synthase [Veronia nyctiphanis]